MGCKRGCTYIVKRLIFWDFDFVFLWIVPEGYLGNYLGEIRVGMMEYLGDRLVEIIDFFELVNSYWSSSKVYIITII